MVAMRNDSSGRTMGRLWKCAVSYDDWGAPYGKAHDGSVLRLHPDGKTADSNLYGTEWAHFSGPPVEFP
jgi:hypothetical protein